MPLFELPLKLAQPRKSVCVLSLSLLLSYAPAAIAGGSEWKTYFEAGKKLLSKQQYAEAKQQLELAEQKASGLAADSPDRLLIYDQLILCYTCTGNQRKGEELAKQVLEIREKAPKRNDLLLYQTIVELAAIYTTQEHFAEAEELYKRGLAMFSGKGPVKSLLQALCHAAIANQYVQQDRYDDAEASYNQALACRKQSFIKGAMPMAFLYEGLGQAQAGKGKFAESDKNFQLAIEGYGKERERYPRLYGLAKANYARYQLFRQGKYVDARKEMDEAAEILKKTDGDESVALASLYSSMADVAIMQDHYDEAEVLVNKALVIHRKQLETQHTSIARDLTTLKGIYRNQGKYDQAEECARQALSIYEKQLGAQSGSAAEGKVALAVVLSDKGKWDESSTLLNEAIATYTKLHGDKSVALVPALVQLAYNARETGRKDEGEQLLTRAAQIQASSMINANPANTARIYSDLAWLYWTSDRLDEAENSLKRSLAIKEKIFAANHSALLSDLSLLNKIYAKTNRTTDASTVDQRISQIKKEHPELAAPKIAETAQAITPSSDKTEQVRDKWALVIGISSFADQSLNLKYAAKDAIDFSRFLVNDAHFKNDHVRVLSDKQAGKEAIMKSLGDEWLGRLAHPDDLVLIYISSHGSTSRDEAGGVNFLAAYDTSPDALVSTGLPMQWLSQIIKEQVHSKHVVLILDVCHSGVASGEKGLTRGNAFDAEKLQVGEGQAIICSSAPDQVSWESKNYPNSVFTRRLIEGLKQKDKTVDLNQAFSYLKEQVESEVLADRGRLQTPLLFSKAWKGPPPVISTTTAK